MSPVSDRPVTQRRPDASMSLLNDLANNTVVADYQRVHDRSPNKPGSSRGGTVAVVAVLVAAGLVLGIAAGQTRGSAPAVAAAHKELIDRVQARNKSTDDLQKRLEQLRADVDATRAAALEATSAGSAARAALDRLSILAGISAVHGPGIKVVVDDAPNSSARGEGSSGRIRDTDLQRLINGLWAAGAEAVSVNNQRLTSLTAVRSAGDAILVAYRPLSPPYEVLAIGKADDLEVDFVDGPGGRWFHTLAGFGIRFNVSTQQDVTLPGASGATLRRAEEGTGQ
ncbi:MAG TPA: DUF881 domain-containing protein [Sporichthyaceae bacterium]|nr:DUF881 domain-containing protein [Sporichthyaceae bacterium]